MKKLQETLDVSETMNTFLSLWPDDVEITKEQINKMQNAIIRSHQELLREIVKEIEQLQDGPTHQDYEMRVWRNGYEEALTDLADHLTNLILRRSTTR